MEFNGYHYQRQQRFPPQHWRTHRHNQASNPDRQSKPERRRRRQNGNHGLGQRYPFVQMEGVGCSNRWKRYLPWRRGPKLKSAFSRGPVPHFPFQSDHSFGAVQPGPLKCVAAERQGLNYDGTSVAGEPAVADTLGAMQPALRYNDVERPAGVQCGYKLTPDIKGGWIRPPIAGTWRSLEDVGNSREIQQATPSSLDTVTSGKEAVKRSQRKKRPAPRKKSFRSRVNGNVQHREPLSAKRARADVDLLKPICELVVDDVGDGDSSDDDYLEGHSDENKNEVELGADNQSASPSHLSSTEPVLSARCITDAVSEYRNRYPEAFTLFDRDILKHHCDNLQSVEFFKWKMEARCILQDKFKQAFPTQPFQLLAVGSTINGCGSFNSDLDLCLCVPNSAEKTYSFDRRLSLKVLKTLNIAMKINESMRTFIRTSTLIRCKVPILRLTLYPPYEGLDIDLNVNGVHGIYGSHLLHYYARIDDRFAVICLLVKHWAIRNDIGSAKCGSLSSYSIALLVLHFFQCGIEPAVLPNLQQLYPAKFSRTTPLEQLKLFQIMDPLPERPLNHQTVGELLAGFFHYYASFNFSALGISIEKACVFPRTYASPDSARYQLFIEEPFDGTNTARSVTKPLVMTQVRKAFCFARDAFRDHPPSLKRINVSVGNE